MPRLQGDATLRRLLPGRDFEHEIVSVDIANGSIRRFAAQAPRGAAAGGGPICGAPEDADGITNSYRPGEYVVRIKRAGLLIWEFTAVRPSASSGRRGSGIELRNVSYKGRKVLERAHVPILNVSYKDDFCGPYRDWQYEEGRFRADGTILAPGFKQTTTPPATIIQSGTDSGNFLGTAIWVDGEEITLMSELEAGWYRYTSQWTLHTNGTIKPRFGFAGIDNACVCNAHYHHAFWRFDFDIGAGDDNYAQRWNGAWETIPREAKFHRALGSKRRFRVGSHSTPGKYVIHPGPDDKSARASPDWPYSHGDLWFLRYRENQIDDGVVDIEGPRTVAHIDDFMKDAYIGRSDLVVWYAAHFYHDDHGEEEEGGHNNVLGPDLVPVNWGA